MAASLSYREDTSVKMAESASLIPGNLAVAQGLQEDGVAYGLVSRHVATVRYTSSAGAVESKSISFPGSQEDDVSSRTLTGVRSLANLGCAFIRDVSLFLFADRMVQAKVISSGSGSYLLQRIQGNTACSLCLPELRLNC